MHRQKKNAVPKTNRPARRQATGKTPSARSRTKEESSSHSRRSKEIPSARSRARQKPAARSRIRGRQQQVRRYRILLRAAILAVILLLAGVFWLPRLRPLNRGQLVGVSDDVLQYTQAVEACCREYDLEEYAVLLMALMQQESAGLGTDVFQCSESPFNTAYPNTPGAILDPAYSIRVGVETFAHCLAQANCRSIRDLDALKLALQEYNFGNNYADWALTNYGGYSEESALAFAEKMKAELGWDTYGDPQYVPHVLQYITFDSP